MLTLVTVRRGGSLHEIVVAGRGGGAIAPGRLIDTGFRHHGDLWVALARAMGDGIDRFGDASSGPLALG